MPLRGLRRRAENGGLIMIQVCPTDIVHASAERIWRLLTTPKELAAWNGLALIEGPDREVRAGDRVVIGASMVNWLRVIFQVREAVRPQLLSLDIRLPFGVTNDETIQISPIGPSESRVTYN
jgi:uncharacterized protein YndB with AHSA1/START domain